MPKKRKSIVPPGLGWCGGVEGKRHVLHDWGDWGVPTNPSRSMTHGRECHACGHKWGWVYTALWVRLEPCDGRPRPPGYYDLVPYERKRDERKRALRAAGILPKPPRGKYTPMTRRRARPGRP